MVFFAILAAAFPIAVIFLLISHIRLRNRVADLEDRARWTATVQQPPLPSEEPEPQKPGDLSEKVNEGPQTTMPDAPTRSVWPKPAMAADKQANDAIAAKPDSDPPKSYVFRADMVDRLRVWLIDNWYLAIAALSLALAGVFLVQYGVENGLLTPFWRIGGATALGFALIAVAEVLRRRHGDEAEAHTAYLPSTFAGAGLAVLFAAAIAARQLYGLIDAETTFVAMLAISILAVALGWFYGPFLAAIGVIGGIATPFLVGGTSDSPQLFYYYFALIALVGLLIDTLRRWAWISVLTIIAAHIGAFLIFEGGAGDVDYLGFALIAGVAATLIPQLRWQPDHGGPTVLEVLAQPELRLGWPEFPTRVAVGAYIAAVVVTAIVAVKDTDQTVTWAAIAALCALFLFTAVWCRNAVALADLLLAPPLAFLLILANQGEMSGTLASNFNSVLPPESSWPKHVSVLTVIALCGSVILYWRGLSDQRWPLIWSGSVAVFPALTLVTLELWWQPSNQLGPAIWAAHALLVAAVMTLFAERYASQDGADRRQASLLGLSALTMISFALILVLSETALTTSLALMVLLAALLDRKANMPWLAVFVQAGVILVCWRLIIFPGVFWAEDAPLLELWFGYVSVIFLFAGAWIVLRPHDHRAANLVLESAIWMLGAVFIAVLTYRGLGARAETHWGTGLFALIALISMGGQLYRLRVDLPLRTVRTILAWVYGAVGFVLLLMVVTIANPVLMEFEIVTGPPVLNSLFVAYAMPAIVLAILAWKLDHLAGLTRNLFVAVASTFGTIYVAVEIRHTWRGDILAVPGTTDPELYSYTIAMLVLSVGLLVVAFARRSVFLRRLAVIGVGLTIAKVFLIDISGLVGLIRVASFLGLGLSLAGLAWLSRRMTEQWDRELGKFSTQ